MTTEEIQAEADKRYPSLRNHITTEEDVQDALNDGFAEGAEWAQSQLVHEPNPQEGGITAEELAHQIHDYNFAIDKAAKWLYANDFGIGMSKYELVDKFKKAMNQL